MADVLGSIEEKHNAALDEMRAEVATLKREVSELRAEARVCGSLDELQARLDKIEHERTAHTPLKAVTA